MDPDILLYPSPEKLLVAGLKKLLASVAVDHPIAVGTHVSTKKQPTATSPKQITVRGDGSTPHSFLETMRWENFGINVYAPTYAEADELARLVEGLVLLLPLASKEVRTGEIRMSAVRLTDVEDSEQRYITGTALVLGESLSLKINQ